jgi:aspartyl-tRNA(Asn)/glutamyl-tRNA(Gln) amidotransferase subunit B
LERGPGTKSTWGWDETQNSLFLMRAKEDAHDYRYFPDPDLPPISVPRALVDDIAAELRAAGLPHERATRYQSEFGLDARTASALTESRGESDLFEASVEAMLREAGRDGAGGLAREIAGKAAANVLLQGMRAVANERLSSVTALGLSAEQVAGVAVLRASDAIDSNAVVPLVNALLDEGGEAHAAAERMKLLKVTDDEALEHWVDEVLADPSNEKTVADVRGGKRAAVGRLIGGVMQRSGGQADAKRVRELILARLS